MISNRLKNIQSSIFSEINDWKRTAGENGKDIIDLGIGSPDRPPSPLIVETLTESLKKSNHFRYPTSQGSKELRDTISAWYKHKFDVKLDSENEILVLMGSQDGLAHLALAVTDPGDTFIVPDPGYPIYEASLHISGVKPYFLPLREDNGYLPQFEQIPEHIANLAKAMLLNYPSNPLSAVADHSFFEKWIAYSKEHDLIAVHDFAYSEMVFDNETPISVLQIDGAKDIAVEFHSFSKSFNMAGCRLGFVVGNKDIIQALTVLKSNIDYGVFLPIQEAGIAALKNDMANEDSVAPVYQERRDIFIDVLKQYGWNLNKPKATMFVWPPIPTKGTSRQFAQDLLMQTGVAVVPGDAFGKEGEGYVRIALVEEKERMEEAAHRIGKYINTLRGIYDSSI